MLKSTVIIDYCLNVLVLLFSQYLPNSFSKNMSSLFKAEYIYKKICSYFFCSYLSYTSCEIISKFVLCVKPGQVWFMFSANMFSDFPEKKKENKKQKSSPFKCLLNTDTHLADKSSFMNI